ncbi:MAG TPA: hypothetical protein VGK65_24770 [Candidatus Binatia bacterium]
MLLTAILARPNLPPEYHRHSKKAASKVVDAEGHIDENYEEIEDWFEGNFRGAPAYPLSSSLDGWPRVSRNLRSLRD